MPDLYSQVFTAPTRASVGGNSHAASINDFNLRIRQQPWYQQWFKSQGLDPNRVQLSKDQRTQLEGVLRAHGIPLTDKMNIDPAGNLNTPHGFASQPGWLKAVEIAAPIAVGGYFAAPYLASAVGAGAGSGGTVSGASLGATTAASTAAAPTILTAAGPMAASSLPAIAGPTAAAAVAPTVARAGMSIGGILEHAGPDLIKAGTGLYAAHQANSANDRAAQLTAQSNRDVLDYTKLKDEQERQDFLATQQRNYELYQQAQARLDPYRQFGQRSLGQLASPIPGVGSIGARMGA